MIPSTWTKYHRDDDGELLGYFVPEGERHVPVTIFGYRLGDAGDEYDAEQVLEGTGLSYLADTATKATTALCSNCRCQRQVAFGNRQGIPLWRGSVL